MTKAALTEDELRRIDGWWRACNYVSVGQIYLLDNPLLRKPLEREHVKPRLLGHFGTLTRARLHLRPPQPSDQEARPERPLRHGPGHGALGDHRRDLPRGSTEAYRTSPATRRMRKLFRQFSFPGGVPSHVAPEVPGSIHEGGELGYCCCTPTAPRSTTPTCWWPAWWATARRRPALLASSWHSNKFLNPARDGAVPPILHLNGYKIANPTVLSRIPRDELRDLLSGYGYDPLFVEARTPRRCTSRWHRRCSPLPGGSRRSSARPGRRGARSGRAGRPSCSSPRRAGPARRRWTASGRRDLALAPSAAFGRARQPRAHEGARGPAQELQARGAVRREGVAACGLRGGGARGRAAMWLEPARERRQADAGPAPARFPRLRGRRARGGAERERGDPHPGPLPARRDQDE